MHIENRYWWELQKERYPKFFTAENRVLECGSRYENGTIRDLFEGEYTGIDWRPGKNVEVVSLTHKIDYNDELFDAVVSSSMLEHDPHAEASLTNMARMLKPEGILLLSWGCGRNKMHCPDHCPDYDEVFKTDAHHPYAAEWVNKKVEELGLKIATFEYEYSLRIPRDWVEEKKEAWRNGSRVLGLNEPKATHKPRVAGMGMACIAAFKTDRAISPKMADYYPEDRIDYEWTEQSIKFWRYGGGRIKKK